jgi:hypothetical protein
VLPSRECQRSNSGIAKTDDDRATNRLRSTHFILHRIDCLEGRFFPQCCKRRTSCLPLRQILLVREQAVTDVVNSLCLQEKCAADASSTGASTWLRPPNARRTWRGHPPVQCGPDRVSTSRSCGPPTQNWTQAYPRTRTTLSLHYRKHMLTCSTFCQALIVPARALPEYSLCACTTASRSVHDRARLHWILPETSRISVRNDMSSLNSLSTHCAGLCTLGISGS